MVKYNDDYLEVDLGMQTDGYYYSKLYDEPSEEDIAETVKWAEELTQTTMIKRGHAHNIWVTDADGNQTYTDEAQEVFNHYYD